MRRAGLLSYLVLIGFFLIADQCSKAKQEIPASDELENGVMVITNPLQPLFRNGLELIPLQTISFDKRGQYILIQPTKLAVDEEGQVFVLDSRDANIKVFNSRGQFLRIIGRRGGGPGELGLPVLMVLYKRSELAVYDAEARRLSLFSTQGTYLRSYSTATFSIANLSSDSHGNIICLVPIFRYGLLKYELRKYDSSMTKFKLIDATDWVKNDQFQLFKGSVSFFVTPRDTIVYALSQNYEIRIFDDNGKIEKIIQKAYVPISIPKSEIDHAKKGFPREINVAIPDHYDPIYQLYGDDEGRIIAETRVQITGSKKHFYDVFGSADQYLTTITLRSHRECLWKNHKLYTIEEDEEELPIIRVYQVNWTAKRES
jgi:hypothetical protein